MPKMRGFLRGKPKIDAAEWEIVQKRTAARLGDLFGSDDGTAGGETKEPEKASSPEADAEAPTIVAGPGPWAGGPRPPIIVVGVSEIVSVLPQTGPVQPAADPPTIISAAPPTATPPTIVPAATEPVVAEAEPVVVSPEPVAPDATILPAKPIGLATAGEDQPKLTPVMAEPHEVAPAKPIGVMARADDALGDDTWRLPEASPPPVPALARAVPMAPSLPPAAHVFAKQPPRKDQEDDDLSSLVRPRPVGASTVRSTPDGPSPVASATIGRVPRIRPVIARAQDESSAATATPVAPARATRPRPGRAAGAPRRETTRPAPAEPTQRAMAPKARPVPQPESVVAAQQEDAASAGLAPAATPRAKPRSATKARSTAKARPSAKARPAAKARSAGKTRSVPAAVPTAYCPYCAKLLDPAPTTSRRCDRCRQRIVVKRIDGTAVYLTEAAVLVFEAERRRVMASVRWARDRDRWLQHAAAAGAPAEKMAQLAVARLSEDVVRAARKLYLNTVDRAFKAARNERDWDEASRLRRDEAAVVYRLAGSPAQPPDEAVALFREGVAAELRGVGEIARDAELVSARCCDTCRGDDRVVVKITTELRTPRLPHAGCPRGLCRCHWDLATKDRLTMRRYLRRRPSTELRLAQGPDEETPATTSVPAGQDRVG